MTHLKDTPATSGSADMEARGECDHAPITMAASTSADHVREAIKYGIEADSRLSGPNNKPWSIERFTNVHFETLIQAAEEAAALRLHLGEANTLSDQNHALRQRVEKLEGALEKITKDECSNTCNFIQVIAHQALNNS